MGGEKKKKISGEKLTRLFTDGGVIKSNPSEYGGTWAWCLVQDDDIKVEVGSGIILPEEMGVRAVTNNMSELYAAIMGLEAMVEGWCGTLYTDSKVTMYRLMNSDSFKGIPTKLVGRCLKLRRNRKWKIAHIGGHPNRKALQEGVDSRGLEVSPHNVWCDKECKRVAQKYMEERGAA